MFFLFYPISNIWQGYVVYQKDIVRLFLLSIKESSPCFIDNVFNRINQ